MSVKKVVFISLFILTIVLVGQNAFAAVNNTAGTPYTVNASGGTTEVNSFLFSETPYAYLSLAGLANNSSGTVSWNWFYKAGSGYALIGSLDSSESYTGLGGTEPFWNNDNFAGWSTAWSGARQTGDWQVTASWNINGTPDSADYFFTVGDGVTVVPEPLSMALYLIGGLPIGAGLLRRKKA